MKQILAFGAERFPLDSKATREARHQRSRVMLERALNLRTMIAFVGSGCSAPLGYPVWKGLVSNVIAETLARKKGDAVATIRLEAMQKSLSGPSTPGTRNLIFYLGYCQSLLDEDGKGRFHSHIESIFRGIAAAAMRDGTHNPYHALKELPISRYITTNYDRELEWMLAEKTDVDEPVSFTQEDHGQLAGFAVVGIPSLKNAVFHCHGRYRTEAAPDDAQDRSSIVASEADYQHWYLTRHDAAATTFRQSLDLLLNSNPVLFVGYSLEDDDLLRPLRAFRADDPERKAARLLFALSEIDSTKPEEQDWMDSVHERYGVNFVTYERPPGDDPVVRGEVLHREILKLRTEWQDGSRKWTQKPVIRRARVSVAAVEETHREKLPYFHYAVDMSHEDELAPKLTPRAVATLRGHIDKPKTRIVVVTGDGGSGKSWRVLTLLNELKKDPGRFTGGIFFWSSYYADDWLTGLDRALSYFEREDEGARRGRRLERFKRCLAGKLPRLLVFDGFERLLRDTENPKLGRPYSRSVEELLEIMADARASNSTVILTSRLMPMPLEDLINKKRKDIVKVPIDRLTTEDLRGGTLFKLLVDEHEVARVCSLCAGHSYALQLAARLLTADPAADLKETLQQFRLEISRRAPDSRNSEIIKLAIDAVDRQTRGFGAKLLERLAVFMSPVDDYTLAVCYDAAVEGEQAPPVRDDVVDVLMKAKLLLRVQTEPADGPARFTVHPIVRSHVFTRRHGVISEALPNFALSGFTSGSAACHPGGEKGKKQIKQLFSMLCERIDDEKRPRAERLSLVRAAFGTMRSRMESNTVARWIRYDEYIQFGLRLRWLVRELAGDDTWDYQDRDYAMRKQSDDGILYADELAWLYNDVGLALCSEGSMADAYSLWEQGFEIDRVTDSEEEGGQYIVQSHLHMSHLFIELGRLRRAGQFLTTTERANAIYKDQDFAARIKGFRGLLAHLAGNLDEAEKLYRDAITGLTDEGRRNLRAESVFYRHRADLMIMKGDLDCAGDYAELALSLAREGHFPDLEAYARKARAHVWRDKGNPLGARIEYNAVMERAQEFGIKRLQADVHSELARLALAVGDWETARIRAMDSLLLANELSLGIRRTHALVVLGLAMDAAGNKALAINYLQHAWALAQLQGYHLRGREAEQKLHSLGASTDPGPQK